jgi:hypothetical protein
MTSDTKVRSVFTIDSNTFENMGGDMTVPAHD